MVTSALKHTSAHRKLPVVILTCTGSLHLFQGPWVASSGQNQSRGADWDASWMARAAQVRAAYQQNVNKRSQAVWEGFRESRDLLSVDVASASSSQHQAGSTGYGP